MKRFLLTLTALLPALMLFSQNIDRIKADSGIVWAEGRGVSLAEADRLAVKALSDKLAKEVAFDIPASRRTGVMATYLPEIKKASKLATSGDIALRYISRADIPSIFASREKKAADLAASGYADWAWYYYSSLPGDHKTQLRSLESKRKEMTEVPPKMAHIAREVSQIRNALGASGTPKAEESRPAVNHVSAVDTVTKVELLVQRDSLVELPSVEKLIESFVCTTPSDCTIVAICCTPKETAGIVRENSFFDWCMGGVHFGYMPTFVYGFSFQYAGGRFGFYTAALINKIGFSSDFSCSSKDAAALYPIWPIKKKGVRAQQFSVGVVYAPFVREYGLDRGLELLAGVGYGRRTVYWQGAGDKVAKISDISSQGLLCEAGAGYRFYPFTVQFLATTVAFRTLGVRIGVVMPLDK